MIGVHGNDGPALGTISGFEYCNQAQHNIDPWELVWGERFERCPNKRIKCRKVLVKFSDYRTATETHGPMTCCFVHFRRADDTDKVYFNL